MGAALAKRKPTKPPDPWAGIEPANRPTPERLRHGSIRVVDFKENGHGRVKGRVAIDFECKPIFAAHDKGKLSDRQRDAAERLLWLWHKVNEVPGGRRDTLDMTPRGSNEMSADAIAWLIDRKTEYQLALAFLTPEQEMVVRGVCIHEEPIGPREMTRRRYRLLCEGLTVLADVWKMP